MGFSDVTVETMIEYGERQIMKQRNLIYKVTSNEYTGLKREFSTKKEALAHARWQRKSGWWATVTDMRTGKEIEFKLDR